MTTLVTFTPVPLPSPGTSRKSKPKLLKADFGDGYTQTAPDGTNWIKDTATLTWDALTLTQANTIDAFFYTQGGWNPFYYTLSDDSTPSRWTCEDWELTRGEGGIRKITASLIKYYGVLT